MYCNVGWTRVANKCFREFVQRKLCMNTMINNGGKTPVNDFTFSFAVIRNFLFLLKRLLYIFFAASPAKTENVSLPL